MATPKTSKQLERAAAALQQPQSPVPAPAPEAPSPAPSPIEQAILTLLQQNTASSEQMASVLDALKPKAIDAMTPEYMAKNPVPRLKKPCFQNAYPVNPHGLSDATIDKLARLKPGRYLDSMFTITEGDDLEKTTYIHYKNKTSADRMAVEHRLSGRGFAHLVDLIYAEQQANADTVK